MLSVPDRQQKFEQLRAHWEAADLRANKKVVGRSMKPVPQEGVHDELHNNSGSKFRRKLSNGLALISLTQRKGAPGRQPSSNASLAGSAPRKNKNATDDTFTSPQIARTSVVSSSGSPVPPQDSTQTSGICQAPCPLPRSRSFSYIPRPVKLDTEVSPVVEGDEPVESSLDMVMIDLKPCPPSRIPTPSPPAAKRRVSGPRQYVPSFKPPLQTRIAIKRQSFAGVTHGSPSRAAMRSRTTLNLLKTTVPHSASFVTAGGPGLKRPLADSIPQRPMLVENVPTGERVTQRRSQGQERPVKQDKMAVPSTAAHRRSFGPGAPLLPSKRASFATSVGTKHLTAHLIQTPLTAKRGSTIAPEKPPSPHLSEGESSGHSRDLAEGSSPTPTLSTIDLLDLPLAPPPKLRLEADNDVLRRSLGTPNGLGGAWRSSKVFAAANYQVRRLPRSSTFHYFGKRSEAPPPVPPIPKEHQAPPSSDFVQPVTQQKRQTSTSNLWHRFPTVTSHLGTSGRSLLSDIASTQRSMEAASAKSVSTAGSQILEDTDESHDISEPKTLYQFQQQDIQLSETSKLSSDLTALPPMRSKPDHQPDRRSVPISRLENPNEAMLSRRCWSLSQRFYPYSTNQDICVQVKDYMPPLYWAGRFQSRFDQWRTEAMVAVLNPDVKPEHDGPLGQCSLDDDNKATILIFMQLRDLCTSAQAADSLHEFEYRYRKDHKLLDTKFDLPPSLRKPEDPTTIGPLGRAVRRLTPRKASLVNLFKGKGWSRSDDSKVVDVSGHVRELQDIADLSNGREDGDSDSFDPSAAV